MDESLDELNPAPRLLMGPGPINADPRVLRAMSAPLLGQFDPQFRRYMALTPVVAAAVWIAANAGLVPGGGGMVAGQAWHGHEMLFGFAAAIVCAIALTALPGWAGTPEIRGAPLAGLAMLWVVARVAYWGREALPEWGAVAGSIALWVVLIALLARQLVRVTRRAYLLILVVLGGILLGEALFMTGRAAAGLLAATYALVLLFALAGGVFTPVFTGNHLRATGRGGQPPFLRPLEGRGIAGVLVRAERGVG